MAKAQLRFLGAAGGVTGSCYHLSVGDEAIVIDCGTFQGDVDAEHNNRTVPNIDIAAIRAAVFTHGHLDHVGRLPAWVPHGFRGEVLGHPATLDIAKIILEDSAKIANHSAEEPLYGDQEVAAITSKMKSLGAYRTVNKVGRFSVSHFDAGHILGSSSIRVAWDEGSVRKAILFSGDVGVAGAPIIADPNTAWDPVNDCVDYVVTESTYGDRLHKPRSEVRAQLQRVIERALADGGKVLIPAFSIGRTQEIVYEIGKMVAAGKLRGIPVIVDGPLGLSATAIYARHRECYDQEALATTVFGDPPLNYDSLINARDADASKRATTMRGPAIIIAGSGMCQGGRIRHHLRRHLPDPKTDVLLVGYQAGKTLGRALQEGRTMVYVDREQVVVRARITTISGLSAHADRDGLAHWFEKIPRQSRTTAFVTHGEPEQSQAFAGLLKDRFSVDAKVPALGECVEL